MPLFDTMEEAVRALVVSHQQFRYLQKKENPYEADHKESARARAEDPVGI
jgi:hypothetical protein